MYGKAEESMTRSSMEVKIVIKHVRCLFRASTKRCCSQELFFDHLVHCGCCDPLRDWRPRNLVKEHETVVACLKCSTRAWFCEANSEEFGVKHQFSWVRRLCKALPAMKGKLLTACVLERIVEARRRPPSNSWFPGPWVPAWHPWASDCRPTSLQEPPPCAPSQLLLRHGVRWSLGEDVSDTARQDVEV